MKENTNNTDIAEDKALVDQLFAKEELIRFEEKNKQVPANYFDNFESTVLAQIKHTKKKETLFTLPKWSQVAIAASALTIIATSVLFYQTNDKDQQNQVVVNLQEIPTAEIDNYINANEYIAEIDWQTEMDVASDDVESLQTHLSKDSNKIQ